MDGRSGERDTKWNLGIISYSHDLIVADINRVHFTFQKGNFYIVKPGVIHSQSSLFHTGFAIRWKIDETSECRVTNIDHHFRMSKYLERMNSVCHRLINDSELQVQDRILSIAMDSDKNNHFATQLSVLTFLIMIPDLSSCSLTSIKELDKVCDVQESIVDMCVRYITDNCLLDIDVDDVAEYVHFSYGYVSRAFRNKMSITINKLINRARLHKAQYYLISSNESIQCIAHRVGFSTENYFSLVFKKAFQCTPTEYRKIQRRLDE